MAQPPLNFKTISLGRDLLDLIATKYDIFKIVIFKMLARGQGQGFIKTRPAVYNRHKRSFNMDRIKWIIVVVMILLATSVSAEMFKYVDKDGNVLYTDDISVVPEEQRSGVDVLEGAVEREYSTPEDKEAQPKQTEAAETEDSEEKAKHLAKQREALDKEAKTLQEEIDALKKEKEAIFSSARYKRSGIDSIITKQLKALKKKIAASKKKSQEFEERKAAYEAEMKALQGE